MTLKRIQTLGLMGRNREWVQELMTEHRWKRTPSVNGSTTYVNWNDAHMTRYEKSVVVGARVQFPNTAMSADLTVLSEYFLG